MSAAWSAEDRFDPRQAVVSEVCARFSAFDHNGDGTLEIERLRLQEGFPWTAAAERGLLLVLVEDRLWAAARDPHAADLRPALRTFAQDLAAEGYDTFLLSAAVYRGEKHQDGRTVLALRAFFRQIYERAPDFRGVLLVGDFPDAFIVRQYFWRKRGAVTLREGQPNEKKFEPEVDYWRTRAEPVATKAELVLSDLDGRWDEVYHEAAEECPEITAVFPEGADQAQGVTADYECRTWPFEDFFFVHDGRWRTEVVGPGRIRLFPVGPQDEECTEADRQQPNPLARPEIVVSRIDAFHAGVEPNPAIRGTAGETLLDANGVPQAVTFEAAEQTPHPLHLWEPSEKLERQLLVEYFDRNHRYRQGDYAWARKPACFSTEWGSSLPEMKQQFPEWADFEEEGYDVQGPALQLLDFVRWLKRPALLRAIKGHTDPWGTSFGKTEDLDALHEEVGGTIWHWKRAGNTLSPSLEQESGKASFATYRTLYENGVLPDCPNFFLHTGCDSITPEGGGSWPYTHPRYGFWQGAECLLMYCRGLVLLGRGKVFNDEPREFFETLAAGKTWGDAWRHYFEVEASDASLNTDEEGIRRKKAYFWSVVGDWTLTLFPATSANTFSTRGVCSSILTDSPWTHSRRAS